MLCPRTYLIAAISAACLFASAICRAATFNWPTTPAWGTSPGNGQTETVDYSYNAQGSLVVSVFNSGETFNAGYPQRAAAGAGNVTGGVSQASLQLATTTTASTSSYSQMTIKFNYTGGATNVSFTIWDVDWGGNTSWIDVISNISATTTTGSTIYATVTGSSANSVTGSGTAAATATGTSGNGNTSANGNVTISFGATAITSATFRWSNTAPTTRTQQYIGVSPITFTPVGTAFPEVGSAAGALAMCGGLLCIARKRQRRSAHTVSGVSGV